MRVCKVDGDRITCKWTHWQDYDQHLEETFREANLELLPEGTEVPLASWVVNELELLEAAGDQEKIRQASEKYAASPAFVAMQHKLGDWMIEQALQRAKVAANA
jgi:hypothetical protein